MPPILRPDSIDALQQAVRTAAEQGGTVHGWDLSALDAMVDYTPEDMTVTVAAGMRLSHLAQALDAHAQWLPVIPPGSGHLDVGHLVSHNLECPLRPGYGTVRDWLIGITVVLGDGTRIRSGGRVVKNVAGFDLAKLFIGARGSLGIPVEVTFKVLPRPAASTLLGSTRPDAAALDPLLDAAARWPIQPVRLDAWRRESGGPVTVRMRFDGTPEAVAAGAEAAGVLGFAPELGTGDETDGMPGPALPHRISVLPSRLPGMLRTAGDTPFLARLLNGIVWLPSEPVPAHRPTGAVARRLADGIKARLDPRNVLPPLPA